MGAVFVEVMKNKDNIFLKITHLSRWNLRLLVCGECPSFLTLADPPSALLRVGTTSVPSIFQKCWGASHPQLCGYHPDTRFFDKRRYACTQKQRAHQ